ncbi:apolipo protein O-domain-containing protein [Flammula alnicola]|nr:apolipo protein O-domain-containing protein [Flammula alnicola]
MSEWTVHSRRQTFLTLPVSLRLNMFRTASRVPRRAIISATVAGTAVGLHEPQEKLSIYPSPTPEILLVNSPSRLEKEIGVVRRHVLRTYGDAHAHVQGWVSKWIGVEHAVENRVKSIISPEESLTPGLLYAGIATLTGSILARNRMLPTRLLLPPIFLVVSAQHFLPKTTGNLSEYLGDLEDTYFPTLAQKHEVAKAHSQMTWERVKEATKSTREQLDHGAVVAVDKIQEVTGLKLKETLGWERGKAQEVEKAVEAAKVAIEHKVEEVEKKVEKSIEDAKTLV